jgi:3-methyl-2-oxobutanoate hydroxymethyltransferase
MADYLVSRLRRKQRAGERIVSITAYDYFTALLAREADVDFVLVGDSLGNVVQGAETTVGVTLKQMIYHARVVCKHFPAERVVIDMPFGTFKLDAQQTIENCVKAFKDSGCGAVKFEGATSDNLVATDALVEQGIPVLGHLGLLPQRVYGDGGYRMQGKTKSQAAQLKADAQALERAGAFAVVLECVVPEVAEEITDILGIPTIGIGSGNGTTGQIIVAHDILGMLPGEAPSFARQYVDLFSLARQAVEHYAADVRHGEFPPEAKRREPTRVYGSGERKE